MDRVTRKDLKKDKFALEVRHGLDYVTGHRSTMIRWAVVAGAVVVVVLAVYLYIRHQAGVRSDRLEAAMRIETASIGKPTTDYALAYPTEADRNKAASKEWTAIASKYPGTNEGVMAEYFLAAHASEAGNLAEAERRFKTVVDSGKSDYVSMAQLALAQLYASKGNLAEAEKVLQALMAHPTALVSKEAAIITLAHIVTPTDPARARKLLEPLRGSERQQVSRAALTAISELGK